MKVQIKHISGSKAGQIENFSSDEQLLKIGRSDAAHVAFDPELDDTVSREHAIITKDDKEPDVYWITDTNSRNGLFVNNKRITGKTELFSDDKVQLGSEGPVFVFELTPKPSKKTRKVNVGQVNPTVTVGSVGDQSDSDDKKSRVGRNTVKRMIAEERRRRKKTIMYVSAGLLVLMFAIGIYLWSEFKKDDGDRKVTVEGVMTPTEISEKNAEKVVYIEFAWKLFESESGEDLVHEYAYVKIKGQRKRVALYVKTTNGIEPKLNYKSMVSEGLYELIRGGGTGSGFVVSKTGHILTNRHIAAAWYTSYNFPSGSFPGYLYYKNENHAGYIDTTVEIMPKHVNSWIPADALSLNNMFALKNVKGVNLYLDVTFANNDLRIPAHHIVRPSNKHDAAMIKIDLPELLPTVELYDNYSEIKTGNEVTVMGFPGMSPAQYVLSHSNDPFNTNPQIANVPIPSLSSGYVSRLIKGNSKDVDADEYFSPFGDSYQLTINSTGAGNSGGPMFDNKGRVIGIYSSSNARMSFGVPIKYGIELMKTNHVITPQ